MELLRDPDADLVAACRCPGSDGFEQAFEQLFHKYRSRVYAIAFRILGSSSDAMDVVQESFALVFRKLHGFRGGSLFSTWLFRIVVNCSIDHRRRDRPHLSVNHGELEPGSHDPCDDAPGPQDRAESRELGDQVQQAIAMLTPKLRVILALRYLEEMSYEELAATLALSIGTVKSRLSRAHLALEQVVREHFPQLQRQPVPGTTADAGSGTAGGDEELEPPAHGGVA